MKIKLVSDLHLEFSDIVIHNDQNCDVLILGGDICIAEDLHRSPVEDYLYDPSNNFRAQRFRDFFARCSQEFSHVMYVAGNHEFYNGKFYAGLDYLREECARYGNVYFLERDTKAIDDVVFVGATLWTDLNRHDPLTMHAVEGMMNDYRSIRNDRRNFARLSSRDTYERHRESLQYIKIVVAEQHETKFVVVGHHSPSTNSVHPDYQHDTLINGAYHSDLSDFILSSPQIKLWTHGHTHHSYDYVIGATRIVCNPRGYEGQGHSQNTGWNPNIVLEV
jgi:Icc-related predicted phosphoesterase